MQQRAFPKSIHVRTKEVDGNVLVHDEIHRHIHVLNVTAAKILYLCDGNHSLDMIVEVFAVDPEVTKDQVRRDVELMIEQFKKIGLLEHT